MKRNKILIYIITLLLLIGLFFYAIQCGGIEVTFSQLINGLFIEYDKSVSIIYELRFPRILVAIMSGAMMSVSGVLMQSVMKNPLADPGIIGVSSGAAFMASLIAIVIPSLARYTPVFAFIGGILAFLIVYALNHKNNMSVISMILTGIAVDALFNGLYNALETMGGGYSSASSIIKANISLKSWDDVYILLGCFIVSMILSLIINEKCDLLSLSDKNLVSIGINVKSMRLMISVLSVFMASIFTSMVGIVSFLGLVVPHIARLIIGSRHKDLIPYSALLGSLIFLFADTAGRVIAYPYEISSSIIMSVIGGPLFIILLKRSVIKNGR